MPNYKRLNFTVFLAASLLSCVLTAVFAADCPAIKSDSHSGQDALKKLQRGGAERTDERLKKLFDEAIKKGDISPIRIGPASGPAPLNVDIGVIYFPIDKPAKIEIDVNADGKPEWVGSSWYEILRNYKYTKPGQYHDALIVRDAGDKVSRYRSNPVMVVDQKQFDRELRSYWESFRTALQRKDLQAAFHCTHQLQFRDELEDRLREIMRGGAALLAREYSQLEIDRYQDNYEAHYLRTVPQRWMPVHFAPDSDGIGRITQS